MPGLLDLSREVREKIFAHCLAVHGDFLPFEEYYPVNEKDQARLPDLALLSVSKTIRAEAIHAFYGVNSLRIGPSRTFVDGVNLFNQGSNQINPLRQYHEFRRVVLYFDQFDIDRASAYERVRYEGIANHQADQTDGKRTKAAHKIMTAAMHNTWSSKRASLKDLMELSSLVLDVDRLACLLGCHRYEPLQEILREFDQCARFLYRKGCRVTVKGLHEDSEVKLVQRTWRFATAQRTM